MAVAVATLTESVPGAIGMCTRWPAAAIAAFVMVLAAVYLLFMYGRIVFGELSDFLKGLGDHLARHVGLVRISF